MSYTTARAILVGLLSGALALTVHAQQPATTGAGTIKKLDAKAGTITLEVPVRNKKKKDDSEKEFLLVDDAKVTVTVNGTKKELKGKEALSSGALKVGDSVTYKAQGDLKIIELTVGAGLKKKKQ